MALDYFVQKNVDVAVIETGLGGRLDSTNVITPLLSVITNISYDHIDILGNTLEKIAYEKAGIIKKNVPVVIGQTSSKTKPVFEKKAQEMNYPISFAEKK
jgi:dihydrofolate synthase/folylpolyglutamate synthase